MPIRTRCLRASRIAGSWSWRQAVRFFSKLSIEPFVLQAEIKLMDLKRFRFSAIHPHPVVQGGSPGPYGSETRLGLFLIQYGVKGKARGVKLFFMTAACP